MARKKVTLAFITNQSARKATYKKRKNGMLKKVNELSTLCGVDACAIIYNPSDSQPEVWPSPLEAQRVLAKFNRMPEMEQDKNMVNQEGFLRQRIVKAVEKLEKLRKENREEEISHEMYQGLVGQELSHLSDQDLNDLAWVIKQKLESINNHIDTLKNGVFSSFAIAPSTTTNGESMAGGLLHNVQNEENRAVAALFDANAEFSMYNQLLMDPMNWNDQMDHHQLGGASEIMPLGDINNNGANLWSNGFFPWQK